jgi:hypothetical protein
VNGNADQQPNRAQDKEDGGSSDEDDVESFQLSRVIAGGERCEAGAKAANRICKERGKGAIRTCIPRQDALGGKVMTVLCPLDEEFACGLIVRRTSIRWTGVDGDGRCSFAARRFSLVTDDRRSEALR